VELAFLLSRPLSEIARQTNKESINLNAELTLRTLGREAERTTTRQEPPGRELGDDEAGLAVIRSWLERAGIPTEHMALHDGSGLSRLDLVTPEATARLLIALSKSPANEPFRESLPVAGKDGTLAGRLKTVGDRVSAKTGSLTYDNSLSGYILTSKGKLLAFSIMCNDQTGRASSTQLIDQVVGALSTDAQVPGEDSSPKHRKSQ
jgi:D-alanyl-D-alanine carboxypeptidase/D-alanyl-D-alanine-endopeptidase (penicillin-binding protein 4)